MFKQEMKPLVAPLADLMPGEKAKIVFITPESHSRLDRLSAMGVVPGSTVKLHQKRPSYVIQLGETMVAVDKVITKEIFVKNTYHRIAGGPAGAGPPFSGPSIENDNQYQKGG